MKTVTPKLLAKLCLYKADEILRRKQLRDTHASFEAVSRLRAKAQGLLGKTP